MNIFITLSMIAINMIAVIMIYQFIKKLPQKEKLIFIAISIAVHYMLISFVYWLSGWGLDQNIQSDRIIFAFVPINVILSIPFLANAYTKMKDKKIKQNSFRNRIIIVFVITILALILEYSYFKGYQNDMIEKIKNRTTNTTSNTVTNTITNTLSNTIANTITNTTSQNIIK